MRAGTEWDQPAIDLHVKRNPREKRGVGVRLSVQLSLLVGLTHFILGQFLLNLFVQSWAGFIDCLLGPFEQLSVKYISNFPVFMKLFPKMSDTTKMVSRMKWVNFVYR